MAKVIMVQGTMSNVGKTLFVAGLCRVCKQDGYRVVPFKSQNMALNSYITEDGLEMGRAQVIQAEAAKVKPDVRMNPILLKPTSDIGSQVIVNGSSIGTMPAVKYFEYKKTLIPVIKEAFQSLSEENDIIVIEGAGSPAEINLKKDDIVNMGLAELVDAPVILVGDIDRGGVFAQLYGTIALLEQKEQERIKGVVINKFRGDRTILQPGIDMLEEKIRKPVVGVLPFLEIDLEEEDSLSSRFEHKKQVKSIDIAIIRYPRISNYTDFQPLELFDEVSIRYVSSPQELGNPDLIFLPGSKSTMDDLLWMRQNGIEALVKKKAAQQTIIWGICGGYQMLGDKIRDLEQIEGKGEMDGIGLLPIITTFHSKKRRTRVVGTFQSLKGPLEPLSKVSFEGYEIHMGTTIATQKLKRMNRVHVISKEHDEEKNQIFYEIEDGYYKGNVYGSYLHGLFEKKEVCNALIESLAKRKGKNLKGFLTYDYCDWKEQQFNQLAKVVRESIDLNFIYDCMNEVK